DRNKPLGVDLTQVTGVKPALGVERLSGLLGPVIIALHDVGAAHADLAVYGDLHLNLRQDRTDRAETCPAGTAAGDHRSGLGQAVPLIHREPSAMKEAGHLGVERCPAADEKPDATAKQRTQLGKT